mgnify:FL=1
MDSAGGWETTVTSGHTLRKLTPPAVVGSAWQMSTVAGVDGASGYADGAGNVARFNNPTGITVLVNQLELIISDMNNHGIRHVAIDTGTVTFIAGNPFAPSYLDSWVGVSSRFSSPAAVAASRTPEPATVIVADKGNHRLRIISLSFSKPVSTYACTGTATGSGPWFGSDVFAVNCFEPTAVVVHVDPYNLTVTFFLASGLLRHN